MSDVMKQVAQGDLLALLSQCQRADLAPLYEVLANRPLPDALKFGLPGHAQPHRIIYDIILTYGRDNSGSDKNSEQADAYADIIAEFCYLIENSYRNDTTHKITYLNIKNNRNYFLTNKITHNEEFLLISIARAIRRDIQAAHSSGDAEAPWPDDLRSPLMQAAVTKLVRRFRNPTALLPPVTLTRLAVLRPHWDKVLPCLLMLAFLRNRLLNTAALTDQMTASAPPSSAPDTNLTVINADTNGEPVLSISIAPLPPVSGIWHDIPPGNEGIGRLNPLLSALMPAATTLDVATSRYFEITSNANLVRSQTPGAFKAVVTENGKIKEWVDLFPTNRLATLVNAGIILNICSFALAQRHLADIENRLSKIQDQLDRMELKQDAARRSIIVKALKFFNRISADVKSGDIDKETIHAVNQHLSDLDSIDSQIHELVNFELEKITNYKDDEWFGSLNLKMEITEHQRRFEQLVVEFRTCTAARILALSITSSQPISASRLEKTRADIFSSITDMEALIQKHLSVTWKRANEINSFFNSSDTLATRRDDVIQNACAMQLKFSADLSELSQQTTQTAQIQMAASAPVRLLVRTENGEIRAAMPLPAPRPG